MKDYFENEEIMGQLLDDKAGLFEEVDRIAGELQQGLMIVNTEEQYKERLNILTGIYMALEPLYSQAEAAKVNEEAKAYVKIKEEMEADKPKVTSTEVEKNASKTIEIYRKVRNILEGYVMAADKSIITIQTQLKRLQDKKYTKPVEEE